MTDTTVSMASGPAAESFDALFKEQISEHGSELREGGVIDALVVGLEGNRVSLDAGLKSQSMIPLEEFRDDHGKINIQPNDFVKVKVELLDDGRGNTRMSHLQYRREMAWQQIKDAFESNETIEGVIRERVKGGYSVHCQGLRAFLPGSLVDLFPTKRDDPELIGRTETFHIERLKGDSMSMILNRRAVRERELAGCDLSEVEIKAGDVFQGKVVATVDYPDYIAYVHIGEGIHGRLHRDDLSWQRVGNISEALAIDQELQVVVLAIDREKSIVTLGAKQLQEDPLEQIEKSYPYGSRMWGKVTLIRDYGAFVEIEKGIEGMVHTSEMDWLQRSVNPEKYVKVGEEVEVMMLDCDRATRRISLSLKQCRPNPWEEFNVTYRNGSKLRGKIASRSDNLGLFVELPGGLTGLIHISNLSYSADWKEELAKYEVGQEIDVFLLGVDLKAQRISLGIKQLSADPFDSYVERFRSREPVKGKVHRIEEKFARIKFPDAVEAILPIGEVSIDRIESIADRLKVGDEIEALIIDVDKRKIADREQRKIVVSIKAVAKARESAAVDAHRGDPAAASERRSTSSFGAMVSETLKMGSEDEGKAKEEDAPPSGEQPS